MIISLNDTTTSSIAQRLLDTQEDYSMATGRVLTLIVMADSADEIDSILGPIRDASHEHPSRVLVLVSERASATTQLDATILFGGDSGVSETVIMTLKGELADHADSVVTPLLLPDTPIVAWWPTTAPAAPSQHPIGKIAQRRITNARHNVSGNALLRVSTGYTPGDSDMMWSRITMWRGVVASALDRPPHDAILSVTISGPAVNPAVDIAAGWLAARLDVPVIREATEEDDSELMSPRRLHVERESGTTTVEVVDARTVKVSVPGSPDAFVALSRRPDADCLAEELRHLDRDLAYENALQALGRVSVR